MSHSGKEKEDMSDKGSESEMIQVLPLVLSLSSVSFEVLNHLGASRMQVVQEKRRRTLNDSDDDGTGGTKRMRGLEELGMGVVSKIKVQAQAVLEHVQQVNASTHDSKTGNCLPNSFVMNFQAQRGHSDSKVSGIDCSELKKSLSMVSDSNNTESQTSEEHHILGIAENTSSDRLLDVSFVGEDKPFAVLPHPCWLAPPPSTAHQSPPHLLRRTTTTKQPDLLAPPSSKPRVHGNISDERNMDVKTMVLVEALQTHEDAIGDESPLRILLGTVNAKLVSWLKLKVVQPSHGRHLNPI
ncbi:hypothetical protein SLEP1_g53245 [Rubroshorea leprosula]|uniref:Uncharacterized protein n=1 Tax=Rubroshorea leprosula TaxID=152421 RepID=A0AAV5M8Z6_9ROSI|nr:hypothetical protein SLEP1_g53245 [Rubroshorea leprosula]